MENPSSTNNISPVHPRFSFAFQPIVNAAEKRIVSYEALVRGVQDESAFQVFQEVREEDLYRFDEACRVRAIELATELGLACNLNLNLFPRGLEASPTAISSTIEAAERCGLSLDRLVLEITESEIIHNFSNFVEMINQHRSAGFQIAIDDFGAGYSGLNLLAEFQPDIIKIDIQLIRGIESNGPKQAIIRGIARTCLDLGIDIMAEGVETLGEYSWFREEGIDLFQGYLFGNPGFHQLPSAVFPA
jgi:EAL domain-containing protein (putative c-di-GMP-specific phosphodiesterase class I)